MSTDQALNGATAEAVTINTTVEERPVTSIAEQVREQQDLRRLLEKVLEQEVVVHDDGPNANLFDTRKFNQCYRVAQAMAEMSILPDHLKQIGSQSQGFKPLSPRQIAANCFRIVNQAVRWGFDPYAIVDETYVVAGKLGYQGKLIAAVVNARAGLEGRLRYTHDGKGADRTVTVTGRFKGDPNEFTVTVRLGDVVTGNDMWKKDPDQKLCYTGAIKWARRYCPEVVLGVLTDDDLDRIKDADADRAPVSSLAQLTEQLQSKPNQFVGHVGKDTLADPPADPPTAKQDKPAEPRQKSGSGLFPKGNPDAVEGGA